MDIKFKDLDYTTYGKLKHNETFKYLGKAYIKLDFKITPESITFTKALDIYSGELVYISDGQQVRKIKLEAREVD